MVENQNVGASEEGASLDDVRRTLVKNRWVILALAVVVTAGTAFFTLSQTKIYRASAMLQIDPTSPSPLGREVPAVFAMGADAFWSNQEYYATQYKIIASRKLAGDVVRALSLNRDAGFMQNLPQSANPQPSESSLDAAINVFLSRLTVAPIKESRLVQISFEDAEPNRARKVLSALIDCYLQRNVDEAASSNSSAGEWLRDQLGKLKNELETSELSLHGFKMDKQILSVSLDDQSNMLREEMTLLGSALTAARTKREHILSRVRELEKLSGDKAEELPAAELLASSVLSGLRASYVTSRAQVNALLGAGKGLEHPEVKAAQAAVDASLQALFDEMRNVKGALQGDAAAVGSEVRGLEGLLESAKQRALQLNLLEIEYRRLERTKDNNEKLYGIVLERSKESDMAGMMRFNNLHVVEEPFAPKGAIKPRVPLNLGIGAIAGLVLGLIVAFVREQMDRTVKSSEEVERKLGLTFLGTLPLASVEFERKRRRNAPKEEMPVHGPELLGHERPASALAEAARGVRTNLMFMSPDHPYRRLLVTSGSPGEGKTTVACAIAVAMAQAGQKVLLVDCDLRRPRLHRVFARSNDLGVATVTLDPGSLDTLDLSSPVPNLDMLPAGPLVPNPAEFLHTEKFGKLLDLLSSRYDRLVIDSSPAAIVSDSAILSTQVDGAVLVVRAGKTPRDSAQKAIRSLRDVSGKVVGAVLNAFDYKEQGYGRYQQYQYRYYGTQESAEGGAAG